MNKIGLLLTILLLAPPPAEVSPPTKPQSPLTVEIGHPTTDPTQIGCVVFSDQFTQPIERFVIISKEKGPIVFLLPIRGIGNHPFEPHFSIDENCGHWEASYTPIEDANQYLIFKAGDVPLNKDNLFEVKITTKHPKREWEKSFIIRYQLNKHEEFYPK